jgi:hypothetical protein
MAEASETGAMKSFASIARAGWNCLIEELGMGAAGAGEEAGAEPLTQHGLSQAQRLQHDAAAWP